MKQFFSELKKHLNKPEDQVYHDTVPQISVAKATDWIKYKRFIKTLYSETAKAQGWSTGYNGVSKQELVQFMKIYCKE